MGGFNQDDTVGGADVRIRDVEAEQKKYANFWVGIQRRVALQRTKGKSKPLQEAAKGQAVRKVNSLLRSLLRVRLLNSMWMLCRKSTEA